MSLLPRAGEARIVVGDALDRLRELPDGCVHAIVTSPPYYGLRDYGTAAWEGGDPDCRHRVGGQVADRKHPGAITGGVRPGVDASRCLDCGAERLDRQIGLEPSPRQYVAKLADVFDECRRVLRPDGTLWLNLGDSYASASTYNGVQSLNERNGWKQDADGRPNVRAAATGLEPKNMLGMPWRVAFELQDRGWILRSDVVWSKTTSQPESVEDRPVRSHEFVFMLASQRRYYFDFWAAREPARSIPNRRFLAQGVAETTPLVPGARPQSGLHRWMVVEREPSKQEQVGEQQLQLRRGGDRSSTLDASRRGQREDHGGWRYMRDVWEVGTAQFPEAHFAVMPEGIVLPCLKAATSERGCCPECGEPWRRIIERDRGHDGSRYGERAVAATGGAISGGTDRSTLGSSGGVGVGRVRHVGWELRCQHDPALPPAGMLVLDPFCGSGTVGIVARKLGHRFLGIELNEQYADLARRRIDREAPASLFDR